MSNKRVGFGVRGSMLILYQAIGFFMFTVFNSFGQNIQASGNEMFYGWNAARVSQIYTIVCVLAVVFQLVCSRVISRAKNIKMLSVLFMALSVVFGFCMATVFVSEAVWLLMFALAIFFSVVGSTLLMGILMGQWFPRRKGTAMGIATIAFPITTGVFLSIFANTYFSRGPLIAYLPFLLVGVAGIIIALIFIKDYPEQCGAYPDNDSSLDPETAKKMMEQEITDKKNSVWTVKNTLTCRDFWFLVIPQGILLATSVGAMAQVVNILNTYPDFYARHGTLAMVFVTIIACVGSYVIGLLDTRFGTKRAMLITCVFAILTGVIGVIVSLPTLLIGFYMLVIYMGAASNFTVSLSAQFWNREDFAAVYGIANPVANVIQAFGPMMIVMLGMRIGYHWTLGVIGVLGVIALILLLFAKPAHIEEKNKQYRLEAGKPVEEPTAEAEK